MLKTINITTISTMAIKAGDVMQAVWRFKPLHIKARRLLLVASHTLALNIIGNL
jgi:hypothetical protein